MQFHDEIRAIHNNWSLGRISKRTAVIEFEQALRALGLIPANYGLNYEMSDKDFLVVLKKAEAMTPENILTLEKLRARDRGEDDEIKKMFADWKPTVPVCAACRRPSSRLFTEIGVQLDDDENTAQERVKLDVPRCAQCAKDYLDQYVFKTKSRPRLDPATSLSPQERQFFRLYEEQMKKFNESGE